MSRAYQVCNRCVMDTTDPIITFDQEGNCNHCMEFINKRSKHKYQGAETDAQFKQLIQKIKEEGKGKPYDCVVGLSGGIDSSYVAYICKQNGLRVLAVHLDNGWNSEEAVQNIKNIARKLEIDYESYVLDWEEFKDIQLAFLKASVPEAETPTDIAIPAAMHKIAAKYDDSPLWLGLTYNSHPVSLAASLAVVNIYESDNLIENANKMGAYLEKRIEEMRAKHPSIGDFRNKGLLGCLDIVKSKEPYELMAPFNANAAQMECMNKVGAKLRELGLYTFVRWGYIFIAPPMCITEKEIDEGLAIISEALLIAEEYVV